MWSEYEETLGASFFFVRFFILYHDHKSRDFDTQEFYFASLFQKPTDFHQSVAQEPLFQGQLSTDRYSCMTRIRRWEIPGCVYHVVFFTRHKKPLLLGRTADHVAREILQLESTDGCYLLAWCIMPNHVHILMHPQDGKISLAVKQIKGRTGCNLRKFNEETDRIWEYKYWDRRLRSLKEVIKHAEYIENNPIKAELCRDPEDWQWSSAHVREFGCEYFMNLEPL